MSGLPGGQAFNPGAAPTPATQITRPLGSALILNAGYEPLQVVCWQKALTLAFQDKVDILEYHSSFVQSPSTRFQLPSVLRLRRYVSPYRGVVVKLSRTNLFLRDQHTCQYCGDRFSSSQLTVDHVIPLSQGGRHEWRNVVASCAPCNNKKGGCTPEQAEMPLLKKPFQPQWLPRREFHEGGRMSWPESWRVYLLRKSS